MPLHYTSHVWFKDNWLWYPLHRSCVFYSFNWWISEFFVEPLKKFKNGCNFSTRQIDNLNIKNNYIHSNRNSQTIQGIKKYPKIIFLLQNTPIVIFKSCKIDNIGIDFVENLAKLVSIRKVLKLGDIGLNIKAITLVYWLTQAMS